MSCETPNEEFTEYVMFDTRILFPLINNRFAHTLGNPRVEVISCCGVVSGMVTFVTSKVTTESFVNKFSSHRLTSELKIPKSLELRPHCPLKRLKNKIEKRGTFTNATDL
jgi:hypothetical protein